MTRRAICPFVPVTWFIAACKEACYRILLGYDDFREPASNHRGGVVREGARPGSSDPSAKRANEPSPARMAADGFIPGLGNRAKEPSDSREGAEIARTNPSTGVRGGNRERTDPSQPGRQARTNPSTRGAESQVLGPAGEPDTPRERTHRVGGRGRRRANEPIGPIRAANPTFPRRSSRIRCSGPEAVVEGLPPCLLTLKPDAARVSEPGSPGPIFDVF